VLTAVRNRWRRSFVASVTVMALLSVALFAVVLARIVHEQIADQAFDRAAETAEVLARTSFAPRLPPPGGRLERRDVRDLDRQLRAARRREPLLGVRLWARDGTVLYGRRGAAPQPVRDALRGDTASAVTGDDTVLRTAAPIVRREGGRVAGAVELTLPYGPVADDVDRRTRRVAIALAVIALVVYLLALPALLRAARALRAQYDPRRVELVRDLKRAIAKGELTLHFQPIADARTRAPHSAEALVRWKLPPDRFIPIVEGTEVMWPLTLHVLDRAIAECAGWRADGHDVAVAVNVSGAVLHDRRLGGQISAMLERHALEPAALEIEVTEGAVMTDAERAAEILRGLSALGISVIAIDDFGTGYSSLARLHELPLDTLKIDQSFVMRMAHEGDASIVCSIIELAHALGLKVIAEGAEEEATIERLASLGCDYVQGYGLTRPLPPDEFADWLSAASGSGRPPARA
jgi:EAL domain-containing protein (putative c-di-GMP-specific phosphodiesterase class I)